MWLRISDGLQVILLIAAVVSVGACRRAGLLPRWCDAGAQRQTTTPALVGSFAEMLEFPTIPRLKPWRTLQACGYDRQGGFYDSGNFLRIEEGPRYVLMEADGPGCIDRMWFTYKSEIGREPYDLLIYLDGEGKPTIHLNLDELFSGRHWPFVAPLVGLCGSKQQPARFSYVPIGFRRSCKVVLVPTAPPDRYLYRVNSSGQKIPHIYYQITYRQCQPGAPVHPFQWDLNHQETEALGRIQRVWADGGQSPWGSVKDVRIESIAKEIGPNTTTDLFAMTGSGCIYGFWLRVPSPQNLQLEMTWDNATSPQVSVPLSPFFGCADSKSSGQAVRGLWMGYLDGQYYCYFPMPFRRGAKISIRSRGEQTIGAAGRILYRTENADSDDGVFCAKRYDYVSLPDGQDYVVLDVAGKGHWVGLVMDHPGHMEGDDRFYVDGEGTPSIHGTGTEDFFNFAWGLGHIDSLPMHGITRDGSGSPVCYRVHLPAGVPFERSLRLTWEHGHFADGDRPGPNRDKGRYSGVAFYYRQVSRDDLTSK